MSGGHPTGRDAAPEPDRDGRGADGPAGAVYAAAAARDGIAEEEIAAAAGLPDEAAREAVRHLEGLGLIRRLDGDPGRLAAVPPLAAAADAVLPALREALARQAALDEAWSAVFAFTPAYEASVLGRFRPLGIQPITDLRLVRQAITDFAARARTEVLVSQPGGARPEPVLNEARSRTIRMLERGVSMRTLYQHSAQFHPPTVNHVRLVVELGADVRTLNDGLKRLMVFDRRTAVTDLSGHPQGALIITDESVVGFMVHAFERAWATAAPFPLRYQRDQVLSASEQLKETMVSLLLEGHDDVVIAKRLGISVRTYQRHLAEIMTRLGARTRLHAGFLLASRQGFPLNPDEPAASKR